MEHIKDQCKKVLYVNFADRLIIYNFIESCNCYVFIDITWFQSERAEKQANKTKQSREKRRYQNTARKASSPWQPNVAKLIHTAVVSLLFNREKNNSLV